MVTLTSEEFSKLTPIEVKEHFAEEEMTVFGRNRIDEPAFKRVKGQPIEMGFGAPGHETPNHFAAIRKYEGEDAYRDVYDDLAKRDAAHFKKLNLPKPLPRKVG